MIEYNISPSPLRNTGGVNVPVPRYLEYEAPSAACTGAITTSSGWRIVRVGDVVTLMLPAVTGTASAVDSFVFGSLVPSNFRSLLASGNEVIWPIQVLDGGVSQAAPGGLVVNMSSGSITVYKVLGGAGTFTAAFSSGLGLGTAVSWLMRD